MRLASKKSQRKAAYSSHTGSFQEKPASARGFSSRVNAPHCQAEPFILDPLNGREVARWQQTWDALRNGDQDQDPSPPEQHVLHPSQEKGSAMHKLFTVSKSNSEEKYFLDLNVQAAVLSGHNSAKQPPVPDPPTEPVQEGASPTRSGMIYVHNFVYRAAPKACGMHNPLLGKAYTPKPMVGSSMAKPEAEQNSTTVSKPLADKDDIPLSSETPTVTVPSDERASSGIDGEGGPSSQEADGEKMHDDTLKASARQNLSPVPQAMSQEDNYGKLGVEEELEVESEAPKDNSAWHAANAVSSTECRQKKEPLQSLKQKLSEQLNELETSLLHPHFNFGERKLMYPRLTPASLSLPDASERIAHAVDGLPKFSAIEQSIGCLALYQGDYTSLEEKVHTPRAHRSNQTGHKEVPRRDAGAQVSLSDESSRSILAISPSVDPIEVVHEPQTLSPTKRKEKASWGATKVVRIRTEKRASFLKGQIRATRESPSAICRGQMVEAKIPEVDMTRQPSNKAEARDICLQEDTPKKPERQREEARQNPAGLAQVTPSSNHSATVTEALEVMKKPVANVLEVIPQPVTRGSASPTEPSKLTEAKAEPVVYASKLKTGDSQSAAQSSHEKERMVQRTEGAEIVTSPVLSELSPQKPGSTERTLSSTIDGVLPGPSTSFSVSTGGSSYAIPSTTVSEAESLASTRTSSTTLSMSDGGSSLAHSSAKEEVDADIPAPNVECTNVVSSRDSCATTASDSESKSIASTKTSSTTISLSDNSSLAHISAKGTVGDIMNEHKTFRSNCSSVTTDSSSVTSVEAGTRRTSLDERLSTTATRGSILSHASAGIDLYDADDIESTRCPHDIAVREVEDPQDRPVSPGLHQASISSTATPPLPHLPTHPPVASPDDTTPESDQVTPPTSPVAKEIKLETRTSRGAKDDATENMSQCTRVAQLAIENALKGLYGVETSH